MKTILLTALTMAKFARVSTNMGILRVRGCAPSLPKFLPQISKKHLLLNVDEALDRLCKSYWQLRRAIATMNGCLEKLSLRQHPDKRRMGHIAQGFDFLGYYHTLTSLRLAQITVLKYQAKMILLYEQCKKKQAKLRLCLVGFNSHSVSQKRYAHYQNTHNRNADKNWMKEVDTYQKHLRAWATEEVYLNV